ncbi:MAG: sensor histidine kinase, partial [Deltaproteobacteria bacterium]|nr:sensor histidine kinase [Deltaproteobacteria bacterium]
MAVGEAAGASGSFGETSSFSQEFVHRPLVLTLYTPHKLSPSLVWHFHLLSQLTNEYYIAKRRARELQQMSYLRAVHETGARLTHDVKNLLQSLSNLCFVAQNAEEQDSAGLTQLLQRQLPQITQRLHQTLEKLQEPQTPSLASNQREKLVVAAELWWEMLQQRYASDELMFNPVIFEPSASIPAPFFDSVADNLLHNAL